MTRSHRRWHVVAWVVLAPLVLAVLVAAVVARANANSGLSGGERQRPALPESPR